MKGSFVSGNWNPVDLVYPYQQEVIGRLKAARDERQIVRRNNPTGNSKTVIDELDVVISTLEKTTCRTLLAVRELALAEVRAQILLYTQDEDHSSLKVANYLQYLIEEALQVESAPGQVEPSPAVLELAAKLRMNSSPRDGVDDGLAGHWDDVGDWHERLASTLEGSNVSGVTATATAARRLTRWGREDERLSYAEEVFQWTEKLISSWERAAVQREGKPATMKRLYVEDVAKQKKVSFSEGLFLLLKTAADQAWAGNRAEWYVITTAAEIAASGTSRPAFEVTADIQAHCEKTKKVYASDAERLAGVEVVQDIVQQYVGG